MDMDVPILNKVIKFKLFKYNLVLYIYKYIACHIFTPHLLHSLYSLLSSYFIFT